MRKTKCFIRKLIPGALLKFLALAMLFIGSSLMSRAISGSDKQMEQRITLFMKDASLIDIINQIRKTTDYRFLFQVDDLKDWNKKEFFVSEATIKEVMDQLIAETNLAYTFRKNAVVVLSKQPQAPQVRTGKKYTLKGKVVEKDNPSKGIPYATVVLPDLGIGTVTKIDGTFELKNLDSDTYKVEITSLGFEPVKMTIQLSSKTPDLKFRMVESNFRLDEVVITATNSKAGASTASSISRLAMDHMQASSLADVMQLLPGANVTRPDLTSVSTLGLRGGASLGTAIIMDGAPISNNSNMQVMTTSIGTATPASGAASPMNGVDMRTITTDNIESIEVITGVPGVEYGDLTGGAVVVNTKAGRQPLQVKFNTNPNVYMFSGTKGFALGENSGNLNVGVDYAYSTFDPTEGYDKYQRVTSRMMYSNGFFQDRLRSNTSVNLIYARDNRKPNPDDKQDMETSQQRDLGLIFNTNGTLDVNAGWFKNIRYTISVNYTDKHSYFKDEGTNADWGYSQSMTDGAILSSVPGNGVYLEDGTLVTQVPQGEENLKAWMLPGTYTYEYDIYGKELNTFAKLSTNFVGKTGPIHHRIIIGADFRNSGNKGKGKVFDPEYPPYRNLSYNFASQRNRAYKDIPFINHLGVYAEENFRWVIGKRELNISAGVRWDQVCGFDDGFSPRINASFDVLPKQLTLRGAYGITRKAPTLAYMYPDKAYFDLVNFNNASVNIPDGQKFQVITTRIFDTENKDLEMAQNKKYELGLDFRYKKMRFFVTAYQEKCDNGYSVSKSVNTIRSVPYVEYEEVKPRPDDENEIARLKEKATNPFLLSYTMPQNSTKYLVRGIDFDFDFGRVEAIRTAFNLNGAYMWRRSGSNNYMFWNRVTGTDYSKYPHMGIFDPDYEVDYAERFATNLRVTHNIPQIGFIVTLTANVVWKNYEWTRYGNDSIPLKYISRLDGQIYDFDPTAIDQEEFQGIDRRSYVSATRFEREGVMPPLLTINLNITKEIKDFLKVSFFANNMFRSTPLWESKKNPGNYVRRNTRSTENRFFFGLELTAIIR